MYFTQRPHRGGQKYGHFPPLAQLALLQLPGFFAVQAHRAHSSLYVLVPPPGIISPPHPDTCMDTFVLFIQISV